MFVFNRITELQNHVSLVEQFDQALITFSQWSENTVSNLHSASQVNVNNLQASVAQVKVRSKLLVPFDKVTKWTQVIPLELSYDRTSRWPCRSSLA